MDNTRPSALAAAVAGDLTDMVATSRVASFPAGRLPIGQSRAPAAARQRLRAALWFLLLGYLVVGVFGRFPWKADEPYSFGIIQEMLEDGQWLVPHVADQPFLEKPPLVYWLGALSAKSLDFIPQHESSRFAVLILVAATVLALYWGACHLWLETARWRNWLGSMNHAFSVDQADGVASRQNYGLFAVLLFAGTLGFAEQIHKLTADLGQLAGCVIALCALIRLGTASTYRRRIGLRSSVFIGATVGTGAGVAFMSKGLLGPGLIALTWLSCLSLPAYRGPASRIAALAAMVAALPWFLIWPSLLYASSPDLFDEWLWTNNVGRFLGHGDLGGTGVPLTSKVPALMLAAFPALPLALFVVVRTWREQAKGCVRWVARRDAPGHVCVALYVLISLGVLLASRSFRDNYLLPLLPGFVLLGLPTASLPSGRLASSFRRYTTVGFSLAVVVSVLLWLQLVTTGTVWPSAAGAVIAKVLPLPFDLPVSVYSIVVAVSAVLLWAYVGRRRWFDGWTASWSLGIAMLWVVSLSLLLPWVDAARSYQRVFADLRVQLGAPNCLVTSNLGESELSMLEYVTDIDAVREYQGRSGAGDPSRPNPAAFGCDSMLVLSNRGSPPAPLDLVTWRPVWHGSRPADANERFDLYIRNTRDLLAQDSKR